MLNVSKYLLSIFLTLIFLLLPAVFFPVYAQNQSQPSQIFDSSITVSDATKFTITGTVTLNNQTSKGYDNALLQLELLQPGHPVEETVEGKKITRISQPQIIAYQKAATVNIKPGEIIQQKFEFKYPATIVSGDYQLNAELFDVDSTSQTIAFKKIALNGNGGFLNIDPATCIITVGETKYQSFVGPTVKPNERAVASCTVQNPNSQKIEARIQVPFAKFSATRNSENLQNLNVNSALIPFEPNSQKKVSFLLQSDLPPNVYEGLFRLQDAYGQNVSSNIQFRWIIEGESASIQNFDPDKSYYKKDDVAKISARILGSADMGWRGQGTKPFSPTAGTDNNGTKAQIKITDDEGNLCGETVKDLPSTEKEVWDNFYFDVPISKDCKNPKIDAQILSASNEELDKISKPMTSTDQDMKAAGKMPLFVKAGNNTLMFVAAAVLVVIIIVGGAALWWWKKRTGRKGSPPTPNSPISPPSATSVGLILLLAAGVLFASTKLELNISGLSEVEAQTATVRAPINSTSTDVRNVTLDNSGLGKQGGYIPFSNTRDFSQNGGDSRIVVGNNCDRIDLEIHASAGSPNTCGNWGTGAPTAVFLDGAPITVNGLSSPVRNEIYPVPGMGDNAFDMLQFGGYSGQRYASFFVTPQAQHKTPGDHTLTVRVGASYMVRHTSVEEHATTFGGGTNCGANAPCYVEIKHVFRCVQPKQCNEECTDDRECTGQAGCSTCRDNGAGKKTCQPPTACNANCTTNQDCASNLQGCKICRDNGAGQKTCQPNIACNATCNTTEDCASNLQGCTNCRATPEGTKTCQGAPPQCNAACSADRDCFGGLNGCTSCVEGSCQKPPACGSACTTNATCERATDGCTQCVSGSCRVPPACGTACTTKADCAGARDGCSECLEGTCTNFNQGMCGCDGFDATQLEYPSNQPFSFTGFAKVEKENIGKALVESITFKISESDKSDPNGGSIIAQSPAYTPEVVEQTADKVRYKASWTMTPPQIKKGKLYRVFTDIKCKPKRIVRTTADATDPYQYQSKVAGISTANAAEPSASSLTARNDLQLRTLNLIKKGETDKCKYLFFEYDDAGLQ